MENRIAVCGGVDRTPASDYLVGMRPEILALIVPVALAVRYLQRRRPAVRSDAAEVLRWWGAARGMSDPAVPVPSGLRHAEPGFDPLDAALGTQALHPRGDPEHFSPERLSAVIPTQAITLQGSALFHTGDRQRVHAAVEGKLDDRVRGTVLQMTCERREDRSEDWIWLCDLTVVAIEGVRPRGPGLLLRRKPSGGGARIALPEDYAPLTLESVELDELYDVRLAVGCDGVAAREALTPAIIAWLCDRAPEALVVETGGASVRLATAGTLATDEELDAFAADACWLAHAFVDAEPAALQAA
ncbi:MAG: hypothetical protein QOK36_267 [Gaiellales bacterium]|nr:hypothetical protein [Gaiellales bacterium]